MKLTLSDQLTQFIRVMQGALFPALQEELEPLTEKHRQLVALLNMVRIEVSEPEPTRMERQAGMKLEELLAGLPRECNVGSKKNSKGYLETWVGYKLHLDVADGQIPVSCILTSASLHDSQAAIPLAALSAGRITNLYDVMDSAYDAQAIQQYSRSLGHVPLIDANPRRDTARKAELDRKS